MGTAKYSVYFIGFIEKLFLPIYHFKQHRALFLERNTLKKKLKAELRFLAKRTA